MWPHFAHLLSRIIHGMPALVSSNWAAFGMGVGLFILYHAFVRIFRGWEIMKRQWKENIGIGILATVTGYLLLFAWSAVVTTYDDHHDLAGRFRAVVNEKNDLKRGLEARDQNIKELTSQRAATQTPPPQKTTMVMLEPRSTARRLAEIRKQEQDQSQSTLKKEILDLSKRLILFAAERGKVQPHQPARSGPGPRFRNTPEWQKYQTDEKQFVTESRDQFTKKFESRLTSVFSQLRDKDLDVDSVLSLCSSNNASSPSTIQQCGAQLRVFVDEVE